MIEIEILNGVNCPILVCDICGERIDEAGKAAVVFNCFLSTGDRAKALHVHKGKINGSTCHEEADKIIRAGGGTPGWQELKACLADLARNVGFPSAEMASYDLRRQLPTD